MKHSIMQHADHLVNLATTNALASEFIESMPKSVAICHIAMGIASTVMTEEQMQALNSDLEPVLERVTAELKAIANKHDVAFSGQGAALIGKATFVTPEDRAKFESNIMPILALKTLLDDAELAAKTAGEATGSFES